MNIDLNRTMQETMQLMRGGDLHAATRAIQRGLTGQTLHRGSSLRAASVAPGDVMLGDDFMRRCTQARGECIEADYQVIEEAPDIAPSTDERPHRERDRPNDQREEFQDHRFTCSAGSIEYKLFIPSGVSTTARPLIVMLHGCTQSPDDFARGTRMNALANEQGYVVVYPAQSRERNDGKCWNWFRSGDQQRGQGEPGLIAALTAHLLKQHRLDTSRVYVAGLSAGGAMAAVLGNTYPDLYAAVGVHSGLPVGAARDLPSAFAAMHGVASPSTDTSRSADASVPTIVFHGDCDTTVAPCNGSAVISQSTRASVKTTDELSLHATTERGNVPGGHAYTRTVYTSAAGDVVAEQWLVHGAGHAWFGGDAGGSYTDPSGPDASAEMVRFFSQYARGAIN